MRWRIPVSSYGTRGRLQTKWGSILINKSLRSGVVDVKRCGDRIILVKLVFGDLVLNVISAYAPQGRPQ
jgi:hypothetical protein